MVLRRSEDDVVIGGRQDGEIPKVVRPFEIDGRPAVPASTLRGLISAVAEAASNSALRVVADTYYSVREPMDQFRPAVGMGMIAADNGMATDACRLLGRNMICRINIETVDAGREISCRM